RSRPGASRLLGGTVLCRGLFSGRFVGLFGCLGCLCRSLFRRRLFGGELLLRRRLFLGRRFSFGLGLGRGLCCGLRLGRVSAGLGLLRRLGALLGLDVLGRQDLGVGLRALFVKCLWDDVKGLRSRVLALAHAG